MTFAKLQYFDTYYEIRHFVTYNFECPVSLYLNVSYDMTAGPASQK